MDTRTALWVSTVEKFLKLVLRETRNFSRKVRGVSAPALYIYIYINLRSGISPKQGSHSSASSLCNILLPGIYQAHAGRLVHRRSLATNDRNQSQTLRSRELLQKELLFGVRSPFDDDSRFRVFRSLTDRPLELHALKRLSGSRSQLRSRDPVL